MVGRVISGRVWKFGDHIDTDVIAPGKYLSETIEEIKAHTLEPVDPNFARAVKAGDIVVAGRNFGCGSSREQAAAAIKALGVGAVLADSFARIFFRNMVAIGLPVVECEGVSEIFEAGEVAEVDLRTGRIRNVSRDIVVDAKPLPPLALEILEAGGAIEFLKRKFGAGRKRSLS